MIQIGGPGVRVVDDGGTRTASGLRRGRHRPFPDRVAAPLAAWHALIWCVPFFLAYRLGVCFSDAEKLAASLGAATASAVYAAPVATDSRFVAAQTSAASASASSLLGLKWELPLPCCHAGIGIPSPRSPRVPASCRGGPPHYSPMSYSKVFFLIFQGENVHACMKMIRLRYLILISCKMLHYPGEEGSS